MPPLNPPKKERSEKVLPLWATELKVRRVKIGKSQEKVALDSGILNQTTVSELEGARYEIGNLTAARLAALARGLDWTVAELEKNLALDFGLGNEENSPAPALRPLPPELQDMIADKAALAPELATERWQQYLAKQRFATGSATPERWWNLFLLLKNADIEPGGN